MLNMSRINNIRDLRRRGYRISEIARELCIDRKTARKYIKEDDFSPSPPLPNEAPSILDPYKPVISEWLEEDKEHWSKQHHTAKRVHERCC